MLNIKEYVNIKDHSTLKVGGQFRYFIVISSVSELTSVCAIAHNDVKFKNIPIFVLGGGSNIVFSDGVINVLALKIEIKGFEVVSDEKDHMDIKVGAGEIWDEIVSRTVDMGLSGFESLSSIPGTVGAGPVQNIGAYGSEVKDTVLEVKVFDIKKGVISTISNVDCKFGYRESIFKGEAKGQYIIIAVKYRLYKINTTSHEILFLKSSEEGGRGARLSKKVRPISRSSKELWKNSSEKVLGRGGREPEPDHFHNNFSKALSYPGVVKYFEDKEIKNPNLKQIREAIIDIRKEKLPNPKEIPNVGSFFKNPIVLNEVADKIKMEYPDAKFFPVEDKHTKVPAGWLIENAGLKGKSFGGVSIYNKNALILVNTGNATCDEIISSREEIIKIVNEKFGIILEQEPEIL